MPRRQKPWESVVVVAVRSSGEAVPMVGIARAPFQELDLTDTAGLSCDEVLSRLGSGPDGLSSDEVAERLRAVRAERARDPSGARHRRPLPSDPQSDPGPPARQRRSCRG